MSLASLDDEEKEIVRRAMAATFDYFTFDFGARMGIDQQEMEQLLEAWPDIDDSDDTSPACLGINNSLNDLLHGEGISESEALARVGVNRREMLRVYRKWADGKGWDHTGIR